MKTATSGGSGFASASRGSGSGSVSRGSGFASASGDAGLEAAFYDRPVVEVARDLVGCVVSHGETAGVIVETEAYHESEPACHAYVGLTRRTRTLFGAPGFAYVYRSYGVHALLNAVSEQEGIGAAVLIRALEPLRGIELMRLRRGLEPVAVRARPAGDPTRIRGAHQIDRRLCSGPGKLTQALNIELHHNQSDLRRGPIVISARPPDWREVQVQADTRIGITRAVELPWRFCAVGSRFLSRPLRR